MATTGGSDPNEDYIIRIQGAPAKCRDKDIRTFFAKNGQAQSGIITIYFPLAIESRANGDVYVTLKDQASYKSALNMDMKRLINHSIDIFPSCKKELDSVIERGKNTKAYLDLTLNQIVKDQVSNAEPVDGIEFKKSQIKSINGDDVRVLEWEIWKYHLCLEIILPKNYPDDLPVVRVLDGWSETVKIVTGIDPENGFVTFHGDQSITAATPFREVVVNVMEMLDESELKACERPMRLNEEHRYEMPITLDEYHQCYPPWGIEFFERLREKHGIRHELRAGKTRVREKKVHILLKSYDESIFPAVIREIREYFNERVETNRRDRARQQNTDRREQFNEIEAAFYGYDSARGTGTAIDEKPMVEQDGAAKMKGVASVSTTTPELELPAGRGACVGVGRGYYRNPMQQNVRPGQIGANANTVQDRNQPIAMANIQPESRQLQATASNSTAIPCQPAPATTNVNVQDEQELAPMMQVLADRHDEFNHWMDTMMAGINDVEHTANAAVAEHLQLGMQFTNTYRQWVYMTVCPGCNMRQRDWVFECRHMFCNECTMAMVRGNCRCRECNVVIMNLIKVYWT